MRLMQESEGLAYHEATPAGSAIGPVQGRDRERTRRWLASNDGERVASWVDSPTRWCGDEEGDRDRSGTGGLDGGAGVSA